MTWFILPFIAFTLPLQRFLRHKTMKYELRKKYLIPAGLCLFVVLGLVYYYFFSSFSSETGTVYVYIDDDDTADSVYAKLQPSASTHGMSAFRTLVRHSSYADYVRSGRYSIRPGEGAFMVFRHLKNGQQTSVSLTVPSVRTVDRLAGALSAKLMLDSVTIYKALTSQEVCEKYGTDTLNIIGMFIPNTYDIYWNVSLDKFLERMSKESRKFWNLERTEKANAMGLTPAQVITLASIVDEETANDAEKPMIAGMYFNRLQADMPLQADPTIKFALKKFELRRIYNNLLYVKSPYNTYKNTGLPPGPIRIPSVAGIDAVLNYVHHDYLYMCAKEDFSGTHNFARTYEEHLQNAAKYSKALNERGIK